MQCQPCDQLAMDHGCHSFFLNRDMCKITIYKDALDFEAFIYFTLFSSISSNTKVEYLFSYLLKGYEKRFRSNFYLSQSYIPILANFYSHKEEWEDDIP